MNPLSKLRDLSTLQLALAISIGVHAVLLTARFVDPEGFNRVFQDTPLEVILVNAKSDEKPDKAKAIAQASLAGGGEADTGLASTPLPPDPTNAVGEATDDADQQIEALQKEQQQMLTTIRAQIAAMPDVEDRPEHADAQTEARQKQRKQLMRLLAEIEKRVNEQNARPRKRYVSPSTREEVYAEYYDSLRHKIEAKGTEDFPEEGGNKLYGQLTMVVTVNYDGRVLQTEIVQSSGNKSLDRRARAIVRAASPYGGFSEAMRRKADQIVVVSRFKFTRDETVETHISSQ